MRVTSASEQRALFYPQNAPKFAVVSASYPQRSGSCLAKAEIEEKGGDDNARDDDPCGSCPGRRREAERSRRRVDVDRRGDRDVRRRVARGGAVGPV